MQHQLPRRSGRGEEDCCMQSPAPAASCHAHTHLCCTRKHTQIDRYAHTQTHHTKPGMQCKRPMNKGCGSLCNSCNSNSCNSDLAATPYAKLLVPHNTAQHSTAQHSTAQHSTAQHSTWAHLKVTKADGTASLSAFCCSVSIKSARHFSLSGQKTRASTRVSVVPYLRKPHMP